MRRLAPVGMVALLALAACATPSGSPAPDTLADVGAPQPVAQHDWFFHGDAHQARLSYGLEESDDLRLGMDCDAGSRLIGLSTIVPTGGKPEILIESGGDTERLAAHAEAAEVTDGDFLTASIASDAPVMQRFRQVKWLALWEEGRRTTLVPHPGSAGNVERFFEICG